MIVSNGYKGIGNYYLISETVTFVAVLIVSDG